MRFRFTEKSEEGTNWVYFYDKMARPVFLGKVMKEDGFWFYKTLDVFRHNFSWDFWFGPCRSRGAASQRMYEAMEIGKKLKEV